MRLVLVGGYSGASARFSPGFPVIAWRRLAALAASCALLMSLLAVGATLPSIPLGPTESRSSNGTSAVLPQTAPRQAGLSQPARTLADAPASLRSVATDAIEKDSYAVQTLDGPKRPSGYRVSNAANRIQATFNEDRVTVAPKSTSSKAGKDWKLDLSLKGYGYGDNLVSPDKAALSRAGSRVNYNRGDLQEWYINRPEGIEQGFTLAERPPPASLRQAGTGPGPLVVSMKVGGDLKPKLRGQTVNLSPRVKPGSEEATQPAVTYSELYAYDA
ncbi:MAG: hypothetical protein ACR2M4_12490, partial [Actinomycetota bacterium]